MGFKPTGKWAMIGIIGIVLLIILAAVIILKKMGYQTETEETRTDYSSYSEFREDAMMGLIPETQPESATNFKYYKYVNDETNAFEHVISFEVNEEDLKSLQIYADSQMSTSNDLVKNIKDEEIKVGFFDKEELASVSQFIESQRGFTVYRYTRNDTSDKTYRTGFLYNKDSGQVVLFDIQRNNK